MEKRNFIRLICWAFILISFFSNFICVALPNSFSYSVAETEAYIIWTKFLDDHSIFLAFMFVISFVLPVTLSCTYLLGIKDTKKTIVRLVNAPFILSLIGFFGWALQLILQVGTVAFISIFKNLNCWEVLPTSALFSFLDSMLAFACSYYSLEILNRAFVLKRLFPEGKISHLEGLKKPSISMLFAAYFFGCVLFPTFLLLYFLFIFWSNNNIPYDKSIIITMVVILLMALLLMILLTKYFKKPLKKLAFAASRISHGDYKENVPVYSADELGSLADTFNQMQKSLQEKDFMRDTFGKIVTPEIRDWLLQNPVTLGGQAKEITVMFCDIRNFTGLSEKLSSEQVVQMLNIYFTKMEECISAHKGVINKYIGDCVMAIFGAPIDDTSHALNAYLAALDMRKMLEQVNREFETLGLPQIKNGIGLNTGRVTVGNIGAESRMEYTVIGDAVNVASRIEGLCKECGQDFLMSEATANAVIASMQQGVEGGPLATATATALTTSPAPEFLRECDIRGKEEKIRIWRG